MMNTNISFFGTDKTIWNLSHKLFTYSKCPNSIQFVVFGSCENSSYLTRTWAASFSLFLALYLSHTSLPSLSLWCWSLIPKLASKTFFLPKCQTRLYRNARVHSILFQIPMKKTLPSARIEPGSSQSKSDHASHLTTVNPQTEGYIYE